MGVLELLVQIRRLVDGVDGRRVIESGVGHNREGKKPQEGERRAVPHWSRFWGSLETREKSLYDSKVNYQTGHLKKEFDQEEEGGGGGYTPGRRRGALTRKGGALHYTTKSLRSHGRPVWGEPGTHPFNST